MRLEVRRATTCALTKRSLPFSVNAAPLRSTNILVRVPLDLPRPSALLLVQLLVAPRHRTPEGPEELTALHGQLDVRPQDLTYLAYLHPDEKRNRRVEPELDTLVGVVRREQEVVERRAAHSQPQRLGTGEPPLVVLHVRALCRSGRELVEVGLRGA